ncbi:MAG: tetratricopeptide repeat protein [Gallionella sp.]
MSVINQVLSQLEQRGVQDVTGQVRPVSVVQRDSRKMWWGAFAVVISILLGILLGSWLSHRQVAVQPARSISPVVPVAPVLLASVVPASPVAASPVVAVPVVSGLVVPSMPEPPAKPEVMPNQIVLATQSVADKKPVSAVKRTHSVKSDKPPKPQIAASPAQEVPQPTSAVVVLPTKKISVAQQAEAEFHQATMAMQKGRIAEALAGYEAVLILDPKHEAARQTLVALLLENKRGADAERVLQAGLLQNPQQITFAMQLARLQVERGALAAGLETLNATLPYAKEQADYHAFLAALLQRQGRHADAVIHYQIAVQQFPNHGVWLMGMGISLQAQLRTLDAKDAFQRALNSQTLSPDLQSFVQQKVREL